jgi:hypothetical protein
MKKISNVCKSWQNYIADVDDDDEIDWSDGRHTLSSGGRPTSDCRAPIHPSLRIRLPRDEKLESWEQ